MLLCEPLPSLLNCKFHGKLNNSSNFCCREASPTAPVVLNIVVDSGHISSWISSLACWPQVRTSWENMEWSGVEWSLLGLKLCCLLCLLCLCIPLDYHDIWIMWAHLAFYFIIRHLLMCLHICPSIFTTKKHRLLMKLNCCLVLDLSCSAFICLYY